MRLCLLVFVLALAAVAQTEPATELAYSSSVETRFVEPGPAAAPVTPVRPANTRLQCASGELKGDPCRFQWRNALAQSATFLAIQHVGNLPTYRVPHDRFWSRYVSSVEAYRLTKWDDGDPFLVNYVGHPMGGAVVGWIEIQNDPAGSVRRFGRDSAYWKSRARAAAWIAVYSTQWELGPMSETSFGNLGSWYYVQSDTQKWTNGTGLVDLVVTPLAGTALIVAEDAIDRYATRRLERVSNNRLYLFGISFLTPARGAANLLRWKSPWHRDDRDVRHPEPLR